MKGFVTSGEMTDETLTLLGSGDLGRVLGIGWEPRSYVFKIKVRINFSKKYKSARTEKDLTFDEIPSIMSMKVTKRMISVVNSCYDPLGLLVPITIQMKIILRKLYNKELNLDWDASINSIQFKSKAIGGNCLYIYYPVFISNYSMFLLNRGFFTFHCENGLNTIKIR